MTTTEALVWVLNAAKILDLSVPNMGRQDELNEAINIVEDFIVNHGDKIQDYCIKNKLSDDDKQLINDLKRLLQ